MKIPLLTSLDHGLTYLNNVVILSAPRKTITSTFIFDTGSPKTILGYPDAIRLQIPINSLTKTNFVKLGGVNYQGYEYKKLTLIFRDGEGKLVKEKFPITIVRPTSEKKNIQEIPTIIGMDFLKEKKYILFCDVNEDVAYLEKKE